LPVLLSTEPSVAWGGRVETRSTHTTDPLIVPTVQITTIDPQQRSYGQGTLVTDAARLVFISGQVPQDTDGHVPDDFDSQCRLAWRNVLTVLEAADMTVRDLAKVTVFLSDRRYREASAQIRHEVLGGHSPALTVIITGIYDEAWVPVIAHWCRPTRTPSGM
jgi:2-iminobutanoate/2-iminopropanoate deaminase